MLLQDKIKHLRLTEGLVRGLGREMTKAEVLRAMQEELGHSVSHAYMCQLESGVRDHMSPGTRALLAGFFKVHPGFLVSDPPGYQEELSMHPVLSGVSTANEPTTGKKEKLETRAESLKRRVLEHEDHECYLTVMERLLEHPDLAKQLYGILKDMGPEPTLPEPS